jgi:hypothetical protein
MSGYTHETLLSLEEACESLKIAAFLLEWDAGANESRNSL